MSSEDQDISTDGAAGGEFEEELGASFLEVPEGGNGTLDITDQTNPSQVVSEADVETSEKTAANKEEEQVDIAQEVQEVEAEEADEILLDADVEAELPEGEAEVVEEWEEKEESSETENKDSSKSESQKSDAKKKEDQEEEEDAEDNEEADKKFVEKFDPNQMPQVNVATLAVRQWQVKVYPLRPSDFMSGQISRVFKQAKESLLYLYTAGNNGKYSNGKAELYMSTISQATKVMHNLFKMDFFHPESNIKIIRKNDAGAVIEKAYMRFDTKMVSMLCQPSGPVRRVGSKRERIIGSVFLKNLPDGATKDMLRVMFPFAAEINFNPEKFKDSTARLVLSDRNAVIPCLKAFSKVELGGNILELRPLEKRKRPDDIPKKISESEKSKEEEKSSAQSKEGVKDASGKTPPKKEDVKPTAADKEATKKETAGESTPQNQKSSNQDQKDHRKPGPTPKKPDSKPRGDSSKGSQSSSKSGSGKKHQQGKFGPQRWQDRQTGFNSRRGMQRATGSRGRGSSFSGSRSRFGLGDVGFRAGGSPGRMGASSMGRPDPVNAEVTKEMIQLQAQLSVAIKNQMSMLNQTQLALEQAKRGAAVSTAAAAAAAMGVGGNRMGLSRGMNVARAEQYSRMSEQPRRNQTETVNRQRLEGRNRNRERRDSLGGRGSNRGNREARTSNFGGKRNLARANLSADAYDDMPFPKRSNLGRGRSWAEESEDVDMYGSGSGYGSGAYGANTADYGDDAYGAGYDSGRVSESGRAFGGSGFLASSRNMEYNGTGYEYGY